MQQVITADTNTEKKWTEVIEPKNQLFNLHLKEVWHYRDLLVMWVKRDFAATYKQTILGPLWFFIQPLLTTIMFTIVFGKFAGLSTEGLPKILFYLAGVTIWNYFSESFSKTATVFKDNASIFGKVYFPRIIIPLSIVVSNLVRFGIQFILFLAVLFYFVFVQHKAVHPNMYMLLTPLLLLLMAGFSLGAGMIISALTTKYRDLVFLLTFGVQLLMYATPIIYPLSSLSDAYKPYVLANPIAPVIETFRYAFLGSGSFSWLALGYSFVFMLVLAVSGILIFNKVEKNFMDTV
jgi:lipopolysaccharide transport system permease protein